MFNKSDLMMNSVFWKANFAVEAQKSYIFQNNHLVRFRIKSDISWSVQWESLCGNFLWIQNWNPILDLLVVMVRGNTGLFSVMQKK
jgi:hypothetical protein